jgi:hypothetical protein
VGLPAPSLSMLLSGQNVNVAWPSPNTADYILEQANTPGSQQAWTTNQATVTDDGTNKSVTILATNRQQFFRLRRM